MRESIDGFAPPVHTLVGFCQRFAALVCSNHYGRAAEEPSAELFDGFLPRHPRAAFVTALGPGALLVTFPRCLVFDRLCFTPFFA